MKASVTEPPRWALGVLTTSALAGMAIIVVLFALGRLDPVSLALATATAVIAPLGVSVLPPAGPTWTRLFALAAILQPVAAAFVLTALVSPAGRDAGLLTAPWMTFALLAAAMGVTRFFSGSRRPAELCATAALVYLPIGAAWLVASRMGVHPLAFDAIIVALTAVHFHYAAFAAPILASRVIALVDGRARTVASIAGLAIVLAQPIVAAGITLAPELAVAGALLLAIALFALSIVTLTRVVGRVQHGVARVLLALSALVPLVSMPLAIAWSWGEVSGERLVELSTMLDLHGTANAYGFALLGLLAWSAEAMRAPSAQRAERPARAE